jgi:hypothetical protein
MRERQRKLQQKKNKRKIVQQRNNRWTCKNNWGNYNQENKTIIV